MVATTVGGKIGLVVTAKGVVVGLAVEKTAKGVLVEISARGVVFCGLCSARGGVF